MLRRCPSASLQRRRSYTTKAQHRPLEGRSAVITGSTGGIGLGIASVLSSLGANIMLNGFAPAHEVRELQNKLSTTHKVHVTYNGADLTKPKEIELMIQDAAREFKGRIEILVNNAGMQHVAPLDEFPPEIYDKLIALNQSAVFHAMRLVLPHMKRQKWGRIVNIASVHGLVASANKAPYVASKHAVIGMTKAAALENCRNGITVNAICPGWVLTPLVEKQIEAKKEADKCSYEDAQRRLLAEKQPSQQFATPEQIGQYVAFLCSDAGSQITGAAMTVDGGWTAQ